MIAAEAQPGSMTEWAGRAGRVGRLAGTQARAATRPPTSPSSQPRGQRCSRAEAAAGLHPSSTCAIRPHCHRPRHARQRLNMRAAPEITAVDAHGKVDGALQCDVRRRAAGGYGLPRLAPCHVLGNAAATEAASGECSSLRTGRGAATKGGEGVVVRGCRGVAHRQEQLPHDVSEHDGKGRGGACNRQRQQGSIMAVGSWSQARSAAPLPKLLGSGESGWNLAGPARAADCPQRKVAAAAHAAAHTACHLGGMAAAAHESAAVEGAAAGGQVGG